MRAAGPHAHFDTAQAARLVGVPPPRLRRCVGAGLISPTRDRRGRLQFGFVDLVLLRTMRGLLERRVPVPQIGRVLASLRRQIGDRPLTQFRVYVDGRRVVAWDGAARWQPESGQFLFDFDTERIVRRASKIARLPVHRAAAIASPASAEDWCDLGAELEESAPAEAKEAYQRALTLDPHDQSAHINLGRLLHSASDFAAAETHYRAALAEEGPCGIAWYNLGVLLEDCERFTEALPCYEHAVEDDPTLADAHYNLALLCEQVGRRRDAVRHFAIYRRLTRGRR